MNSLAPEPGAVPRPLYERLKGYIVERIRQGDWAVGQQVPSENRLVAELKVSRMTAHRALRELTEEGFLARVRGVGTFVRSSPGETSLLELRNIAEEIRTRGHAHRAVVERKEEVTATSALARRFELGAGERLFHVLIVHLENGTPVQLEDRYCNPAVAPRFLEQDYAAVMCTEYLVRVAPVEQLEHVVRAVLPEPEEQRLLGVSAKEPALVLERRSWSGGRVASFVTLTYPGSRYEFRGRYATSPTGRIRALNDQPRGETSFDRDPYHDPNRR